MRLRHKKGAEEIIKNSHYCINEFNEKYFDNNNTNLEIEIGMGKGRFVIDKAFANKNINYIGIEKYATVVLKAIDKLEKKINNAEKENIIRNFNNVKFLCIDIENIFNYLKENSVDKIYLNFSDPWPKKRHEIRRLTHYNFLRIYDKLLKAGGSIELKTDNIDLFNFSLEEFKKSDFVVLYKTYDLHADLEIMKNNIMTEYEEKFSRLGNKICMLIAKH